MERIQRILSSRGVASRRVAEEMIVSGRVSVNGVVVTELGSKADPDTDTIRVDGKVIRPQRRRYVMLNKPRGFITTTSDERERRTVMDLVDTPERLYPVGRLDRDTEGLLLLTNDGELANRVMHPKFGLEKEYHVLTASRPSPEVMERVRRGIVIDGRRVTPNEFRIFRETRDGLILTISLHEGMYHVVRRMMDVAGIPVERLTRVRVGPLTVFGVPVGAWRDLSAGEEQTLFESVHMDLPEELAATRRSGEIEFERERPAPKRIGSVAPRQRPFKDGRPQTGGQRPAPPARPTSEPPAGPRPANAPQGDRRRQQSIAEPQPSRPAPTPPAKPNDRAAKPEEQPTQPRQSDQRGRRAYDREGSPSRSGYNRRSEKASFPDHSGRPPHRRKPKPDTGAPERAFGPKKPGQKPVRRDSDGRGAPPRHERPGPQPPARDRDRRSGGGRKNNGRPGSGGSSRGDAV